MIPKIIHNIWLQGYDKLSKKNKQNYNNNKKFNPEWTFIFWDEPMIIKLLKEYPNVYNVYKNVENLSYIFKINIYALKSDISRCIILKKYGGLYFDIDFECISSFNTLFNKSNTIYTISSEIFLLTFYPFSKPKYCGCFMALEKDHPIWNDVIDIILNAKFQYDIGSAFDVSLQKSNYNVIVLNEINSMYTCNNAICSTPSESSWNISRPLLKYINCHKEIFIFIFSMILIILIIIIIYLYMLFNVKQSSAVRKGYF